MKLKSFQPLFLILFISIVNFCFAQDLPKVVPPSPTVSSLMQFEEVPVDYYSGQPNIQFPIYNKSIGKLNIPIVLRYNTMGLRVNQRSGWVGKGWALDGEVVISRTVRGFRDEAQLGDNDPLNPMHQVGVFHNGFFNLNLDQFYVDEFQDHVLQNFLWNSSGKGSDKYGSDETSDIGVFTRNGAFDKEPDLYQLSLIGQSARFFLARVDNTLEVRMLSNEYNLKVVPTYDNTNYSVSSFTITDTNGIQYILDEQEETLNRSVTGVVPQYGNNATLISETTSSFTSAWKVKEIRSENNQLLATYTYNLAPESYQLSSSISEATMRSVSPLGNFNFPAQPGLSFYFGSPNAQVVNQGGLNQYQSGNRGIATPRKTYVYNLTNIDTKKLNSIVFRDNSSIQFLLKNNQQHPEYISGSASILDGVKIFDLNGNLHKHFDFIYSPITTQKPLFLEGINEYFKGNNKLSYAFDYKNEHLLPAASNIAFDNQENQDIWGYYRNIDNTFGPTIYKLPKVSADKDVVMTGALESITYPTGGKKVFEFESNTISHRGARPFTDAEFKKLNSDNWLQDATLSNARVIFNNQNSQSPASQDTSEVFTLADQQTLEFIPTIYSINVNPIHNTLSGDNTGGEGTPEEYLDNIVVQLQELQDNGNYLTIDNFSFFQRRTVDLLPGTYRMIYSILDASPELAPHINVRGVLYYKIYKENIDRLIYGGGLRIKSIQFLDADNIIQKKVSYNYNENESTGDLQHSEGIISSGAIDGMLSNYKEYIMPKTHIFKQLTGSGGNSMSFSAFPATISYKIRDYLNGAHVSMTKGNYVGYRKVSMSQMGNGKTEFTYTTAADYPTEDLIYGWPFIPNEDKSHQQGLLMSQRVYNNSGLILADTKNEYYEPIEQSQGKFLHLVDDPSCYWAHAYNRYASYIDNNLDNPAYFDILAPGDNCVSEFDDPNITAYNVPVWKWARDLNFTKVLLKSTKTKTYNYAENGTQFITKSKEEFEYEPQNWQIKEKKSTLWEGGESVNFKTEYAYPVGTNFTNNSSASINGLISKNRINEVLGTRTYRNNLKLSETQTIYADFSGIIQPSMVKVAKGDNALEKRIEFYDYDSYGNPLEVSKADDVHISYLWGYDNTVPVAKGVNVTSALINNTIGSNTDLNNGITLVQRTSLKSAIPNAQWSFYEYDPMIGVTKTYDARDYQMIYSYDDFYRLKEVRNQDNYLLSSNEYIYGSENFVKTTAYQVETTNGTTSAVSGAQLNSDDKLESITYIDGLGRAIQSISKQSGGNKEDIIVPILYDELGRQAKEFLPYANPNQVVGSSSLDFRNQDNLLNDLETYYLGKFPEDKITSSSINAYSYKIFEKSPLNRVVEQTAPGKDWHYNLANVTTETVTTSIEQVIDNVYINLRDVMFKEINPQQVDNYDADYAIYPSIGNLNINSNVITLSLNLGAYDNIGSNRKIGNIVYINSGLHKLDGIVLADISGNFSDGRYNYYIEINDGYLQINKYLNPKNVNATNSIGSTFTYNIPTTKQILYDRLVSSNHSIKFSYEANNDDEVKLFSVKHPNGDTEKTELSFNGYYHKGELSKTITKDENWTTASGKNHTTEEFKDAQGRVILKRTYDNNTPHDTQYVYDNFGNLTYVIPPTGSDEIVVENSTRIASQNNYPWTEIVNMDKDFANSNDKKMVAYREVTTKNSDLSSTYGGQGGFTVTTDSNSENLYLAINFSVQNPVGLKKGELMKLESIGKFKDTELGLVEGNDYKYLFYIKNNSIYIDGEGKLMGINQILVSNTTLAYSQDVLWTRYTDIPYKSAFKIEQDFISYAKEIGQNPLFVHVENEYGGRGGFNISIDEQENISLLFNSLTTSPVALRTGVVATLNAKRKLKNRELGTLFGDGYEYRLSLLDNNIVVEGSGLVTQLSVLLSPTVTPQNSNPTTTYEIVPEVIEGLGYIYHYDYRNRLIEKKIPGKGWEHIIYDKLDRPILTQDAKQRLDNKWLFTKYDTFGRVAYTGVYTEASAANTRLNLQADVNAHTALNETAQSTITSLDNTDLHYSNDAFPNANDLKLFTINYYDNYQGLDIADADFVKQNGDIILGQAVSLNTKTLPTVSKVRVLGTNHWTTSVTYYDEKAQPIYVASKNDYLNATDIVESKIDFTGKVLENRIEHRKDNFAPIFTTELYSYDHTGRLLTQLQSVNGGVQEKIVDNTYDELGQLVSKDVGGTSTGSGLQTVDYNYNIRGWLKTINNGITANNDLFGFKINYKTPEHAGVTPLYNGNISETHWQTANDNNARSYDYSYDALNRIKGANYHGNYGLITNPTELEDYSISNVNYDKNGNISSLERMGLITANNTVDIIDNLSYTYAPLSNQLTAVADTASEDGFKDANTTDMDYQYDINGNLTSDANKSIVAINYNHLNLPTSVEIQTDNGNDFDDGTISYVYDATGVKLSKTVTTGSLLVTHGTTTTQYSGNYIYENGSHMPLTLKFFSTPEGYVEPQYDSSYNITGFNYVYQFKDHLGNVRLTYADSDNNGSIDASTEIIEESNYYPFGLKHKGYNNVINGIDNNFKDFQGQELTEDLGLNVHEWKYRISDPAIGRFWQIDPLAEDYEYNGTYNFSENRVIDSAELEGLERIYAADGKLLGRVGDSEERRVMKKDFNGGSANLIATANNKDLSSEERGKASKALNNNSFRGYESLNEAAVEFSGFVHNTAKKIDKEIGTMINKVHLLNENGEEFLGPVSDLFIFGTPSVGEESEMTVADMIAENSDTLPGEQAAIVHTHQNSDADTRYFGLFMGLRGDRVNSKRYGVPIFLSNDLGEVRRADFHRENASENKYNDGKWGTVIGNISVRRN